MDGCYCLIQWVVSSPNQTNKQSYFVSSQKNEELHVWKEVHTTCLHFIHRKHSLGDKTAYSLIFPIYFSGILDIAFNATFFSPAWSSKFRNSTEILHALPPPSTHTHTHMYMYVCVLSTHIYEYWVGSIHLTYILHMINSSHGNVEINWLFERHILCSLSP